MKKTLLIAFSGGSYGTYLEWALTNLMSTGPIIEPFTKIGNSHQFLGNHLYEPDTFKKHVAAGKEYVIARLHPKNAENPDLKASLESLLGYVDRMILLYPDRSHELLCICNAMTKIWVGQHYYNGAMHYINKDDIVKNYPVAADADLRDIPLWIQREHMSFNLFASWRDQVEWYFPETWQHPRCLTVTTKELFDEFPETLEKISVFWNKKYISAIDRLLPYHGKMLSLQTHLGKDQLCNRIVESTLGRQEPMVWGDLCLISQAWIQHQLRTQGYELKCNNLNEFPTDSEHLRSLTYPAN